MEKTLLDLDHTIQTPEGVQLHLKAAGIWCRSVAWGIDLLIRSVLYLIINYGSGFLGDLGSGLLLMSFFLLEWFYPVVFEVLNNGKTPGKQYLNIQVLHSDGTPVSWSSSLIRNILRVVDFLPLFYALGFVSMLMNDRFQRLGDMAANTLVVYSNENHTEHDIPPHTVENLKQTLTLQELQAIIHYAERSSELSNERLIELAQLLNVLDDQHHQMSKEKLLGIANGLVGRT